MSGGFTELTPAERRRALRLLAKAQAEDDYRAERKAEQERIDQLSEERLAEKQAQADEWTARFHALGLPITARVQVTLYRSDGAYPEIWIDWPRPERNEDKHGINIWLTILERLEAAAKEKT